MKRFFKRDFHIRSSIYGQVVYTITILSIFLFVSFGIIFRSVNQEYLKTTIHRSGNNVGSMFEGAVYYSMLSNDTTALQNTIRIINTLPGIEGISMYTSEDSLVHSDYSNDTMQQYNPNCIACHDDLKEMFPLKERSFRILNTDTKCKMSKTEYKYRQLLIRSPILNDRSCYTAACHEHDKSNEVLGSFVIRIPLEDLDKAVSESSIDFYLLASLTTFLLVVALMIFTRKKIKNPLNEIIKASEAVSNGDKNTRLEVKDNQLHDMRKVSLAFNAMLDNLQATTSELQNWSHQLEYKVQKKTEELSGIQNELIHVERIASLGKLSSSVAHEINNPLAGILTYTKLVQKQLTKPELDESKKESMLKYLRVIETETKRCGEIVNNLLDFSRKDQQDFKAKHLHSILSETYNLMSHKFKMADINFETEFSAQIDLISCSENQIKQAGVALLMNAFEAVFENGEILIKTSNPDENNIKFEISDNGIGISTEDIIHIFEPFFSAKKKACGIGLGLAIVHGIVQSHKGKIDVHSKLGEGTTFSITLPIIKE